MHKLTKWVLVDGHRLVVSVLVAVLTFLVTFWLTSIGLVTFRPAGTVATMFGSGVISGVFSLITITLTVNQLVLSRVFGTVDGLTDRLDGTLDFRHTVEEIAERTESPNDPAEFLSLIGETIDDRAGRLDDELDGSDDEYLADLRSYADRLTDVGGTGDTMRVVSMLLGPAYAQLLTATDARARNDKYSEDATEELDAVRDLLKAVAVARQFFKTIAIQQDLAELSRRLVYLGIPVLLVSFYVTTTYTTLPSSMVAEPLLPLVVSAAVAVVLLPLAVLLSHMVRLATIARYTVSVGPFVPPEERN